ncbi:MAG: flavodoxin-dependent (E)-4-hydroxy-3-methylbut-2-enyl-diphosphate synthase [Clostridiales bacterium]
MNRKKTRKIRIGNTYIGGDSKIAIQSMTNTDTRDINSTVQQIKALEVAGCDIVRVAVINKEAAQAIKEIKRSIKVPIVADIHFDYRLAVESIENGADKIRINPGNIGSFDRVKAVVDKARERKIPIRIGINSGSLEKDILEKYQGVTPEGLVESAVRNVNLMEKLDYNNLVFSLKASDVFLTVESYRKMANISDFPLHIGVTEAGTYFSGTIKSSVGLGTLLIDGIGDTIRVSLTGEPVSEIRVAREILKSVGIEKKGVELISCPTCGRCQNNLIKVTEELEKRLADIDKNIKVAVMGCSVNGPGEAKEADIGIAGGVGEFLLFKKGKVIRKIIDSRVVEELLDEIVNI